MAGNPKEFADYFSHLQKIGLPGRAYKRYLLSPILYICARRFGRRIMEIGSGTGSGVVGAFSKHVHGLEINPLAVEYCRSLGLNVRLINDSGDFPVEDGVFDSCILDNVLEHIEDPGKTLNECYRITQSKGGLIIAVPGLLGFESDADHKKFYNAEALRLLDKRWTLLSMFSTPFLFASERLSKSVRQYCLVATYRKI